MAKIDKTQFTKSQWAIVKERRKQEKLSKALTTQESEIVSELNNTNQTTAFVLGNGTSRSSVIPEELQQHGKIYGCNALYRTFTPDYLVAVDVKMILEINKAGYQHKGQVWTNPNKAYSRMKNLNTFHPSKGWSSGPTALWLASQHSYNRIFILGFDYKGLDEGSRFNNVYADTPNYKRSQDGATYFGNWLRQTASVIKEHSHIEYFRVIAPDNHLPEELNRYNNLKTIFLKDFKKMFNLS